MNETHRVVRRIPLHFISVTFLALLCVGCTRSLRQDATKVAKAGSVTAKQMADYYDSLAEDTIIAWELTAFSDASALAEIEAKKKSEKPTSAPPQPVVKTDSTQTAIAKQFRLRYDALIARKRMASEVQNLYEALARLTDYDASGEVLKKADDLLGTVQTVLKTPMPDLSGQAKTSVDGALKDVSNQLITIQQNKAILRESQRIITILQKLSDFYQAEITVYKSIPVMRAVLTVQVAKELVKKKAVISTALIGEVLKSYDLKWPEPQTPFTDEVLIAGIEGVIEARAKPLQTISQDAADKLSVTITKLIGLHQQLENHKPLSFLEFAESSATVQVLLNQLKEKGVPTEDLLNILKTILKEK